MCCKLEDFNMLNEPPTDVALGHTVLHGIHAVVADLPNCHVLKMINSQSLTFAWSKK
jgi:hypothetical protein